MREFSAIVPVSLRDEGDAARLIDALVAAAPEGAPGHAEDALTDRPTSYFAREYVRESVLHATRAEVPHAVAVSVDEFDRIPESSCASHATLHVEKPGQRKIVVGTGGTTIRDIGIRARQRIEALIGRKVLPRALRARDAALERRAAHARRARSKPVPKASARTHKPSAKRRSAR